MNFYGIVEKINFDYGVYGRLDGKKALYETKAEFFESIKESSVISASMEKEDYKGFPWFLYLIPFFNLFLMIIDIIDAITENKNKNIVKLIDIKNNNFKMLLIPNQALANNYSIDNEDIFFKLFKNQSQLKSVMQSEGNSNLILIERDNIPNSIKHYGGEKGKFSYGLYCEHPKDKNILLPLNNYDENIKVLILEEILTMYAALGAKKMLIEDITDIDVSNETSVKGTNVDAGVNYKKETLRNKEYGKLKVDPERAFRNLFFTPDLRNVMGVAEERIYGNQLIEEFTENVNLNVGLDISVVGLFRNQTNFKYNRKWHFKVEFYDRNEI